MANTNTLIIGGIIFLFGVITIPILIGILIAPLGCFVLLVGLIASNPVSRQQMVFVPHAGPQQPVQQFRQPVQQFRQPVRQLQQLPQPIPQFQQPDRSDELLKELVDSTPQQVQQKIDTSILDDLF